MILLADAGAAGDEDKVGCRVSGVGCRIWGVGCRFPEFGENCFAVVGDDRSDNWYTAVARDECSEHWPVGIGDMKTVGSGARWEQLVASDENANSRRADDGHVA